MIEAGDLEDPAAQKRFRRSRKGLSKKLRRAEAKEAEEAEQLRKELGLESVDDEKDSGEAGLAALIRQRQVDREKQADSYFDYLADKYKENKPARNKKTKTKRKAPMPSDEEFAKIQSRLASYPKRRKAPRK